MLRRSAVVGVVAAGLLAVPVALSGLSELGDPEGDASGAPDIVSVEVDNDADLGVAFAADWAGAADLAANQTIELLIDTDRNARTGTKEGAEVSLYLDGETRTFGYGRWDGTKLDFDADSTGVRVALRPGRATVYLPQAALNNSKSFAFWLYSEAYTADAVTGGDSAPDGSDVWTYAVEQKTYTVRTTRPAGTPGFPVAGRPFKVSLQVFRESDDAPVTRGTVQCVVRVGAVALKAKGTFAGGQAQCEMAIPRTAVGKMVRGTIAVTAPGAQASRPFAFKVI